MSLKHWSAKLRNPFLTFALSALLLCVSAESAGAAVLDRFERVTPAEAGWSDEGLAELEEALAEGSAEAIHAELGDVLFTAVNLARHLKTDAESSLRHASSRFEDRFRRMETLAAERGQRLEALDDVALDDLWNEAKAQGL